MLNSLHSFPSEADVTSLAPTKFRFDAFELDATTGELRKGNILLKLQPQPFRVLLLLLERASQLVTRDEIQRVLWKDSTFVDFDHGINFSINQIRGVLADDAEHPRYVQTLPRRGYRFIGKVEASPLLKRAASQAAELQNIRTEGKPKSLLGIKHSWLAVAGLTVLVVTLATVEYRLHHRPPVLTERDTILVADFTNTTDDAVFDGALRQGLEMQLAQSPFLSLISENRVQQTLRLMKQPVGARLTPDLARDLCQRVGSKAYIESSIANFGNDYVISLKATNCVTGDSLAQEQVQALGKEKVLDTLSQAAAKLRGKLGESLGSIQKFDVPLAHATTRSLPALQALSRARDALNRGDYTASVLSCQHAIALDPNFAAAYACLSASYLDLGETTLAVANAKKAYTFREGVSELERFKLETSYNWNVTGDLEKARDVYELFVETYPRDADARFDLGNVYDCLGLHDKGLKQAREALRLEPESALNYSYLVYSYLALNRLSEARDAAKIALAKYPELASLRADIYTLGFLENDSAGMAQQVAWTAGKKGIEDVLLGYEADRSAYSGQLTKAREQSLRAVASAEQAKLEETAASHQANAALQEALFGHRLEAQRLAAASLHRSDARDVRFATGLAMAMAGDSARPQSLSDDLLRRYPEDTLVRLSYVPVLRAQLALNHRDAAKAIETLRIASPYELLSSANPVLSLSLYAVFVRGQAHLEAHQGNEALAAFQKILDHRGLVAFGPIGALSRLGLARAYSLQGDKAKARSAYEDFLTLWKNADPDTSILRQAKAEYAKLS
jgi:DNA-binding winged helix-turn-helix (wHTH) protein